MAVRKRKPLRRHGQRELPARDVYIGLYARMQAVPAVFSKPGRARLTFAPGKAEMSYTRIRDGPGDLEGRLRLRIACVWGEDAPTGKVERELAFA